MPDLFGLSDGIAKKAFERMNKALGTETDQEMEFYNSLTQNDLLHLSKTKGVQPTIEFVKRMEARKLGVKN